MLGSVPAEHTVIVADFEAGIGTLTRLGDEPVDVVVVVVEPSAKSLDVGRRAAELAAARGDATTVVVVANKVSSADDHDAVRRSFPAAEVVMVPDDAAVVAADREGASPVDHSPDAPAVAAIEALALRLPAA